MTLNIDFTPQEEAWLATQSALQGVSAKEIIKRMIDERLTAGTRAPHSGVYERVGPRGGRTTKSGGRRRGAINEQSASTNAEQTAAIALLNSYLETEDTDDPDEIRQAEQELDEFKRSMNANRAATGDRLVYP